MQAGCCEKGETRNWFFYMASPEIGHSHRAKFNAQAEKQPKGLFMMLSCVGIGHGWLQNISLRQHVRIQFQDELFLLFWCSFEYLHHKRREAERNEFYAEMLFANWETAEETCWMWRWQKHEKIFPSSFREEIYSSFHIFVSLCHQQKGNLKGNEDLKLIRQCRPRHVIAAPLIREQQVTSDVMSFAPH